MPILSCAYKYKVPQSYDSTKENIAPSSIFYYNTRFTEVLPNPVVYLYGQSSGDDPILLMVFSSTVPVEWLNGQKTTNLDSIVLKLKVPEQHGYYYKILKISANQILQNVAYSKSSTISSRLSGEGTVSPQGGGGTGKLSGEVSHMFNHSKTYNSLDPIITYSGVGSDTLSLMLRRGQEFPIPNGRINVYMIVRAIRGEDPKIGDIINKHYGSNKDDEFYKNDERFKQDLSCLIYELSNFTYNDLYGFLDKIGISFDKSSGFQYKKVNDFIKSSVFLKYEDRNALLQALLEKESKDKDIQESIKKLTSFANNPSGVFTEVNKQDYVDIDYKLSKNVVDFINIIPNFQKINDAESFKNLIFANRSEIKLMNDANACLDKQKVMNNINISVKESGEAVNAGENSSSKDNFNIVKYNLYAEAYKLKMRISAYNYAISKICCPSSDFDLTKYIKNDDKVCISKLQTSKYNKILALNKKLGNCKNNSTNVAVFNLERQKEARDLLDNMFNEKNKREDSDLLSFFNIDNLIKLASCCRFSSWEELKNNSYYYNKYHDAITLVDKIVQESKEETEKEMTCNKSLVELVATNENNVDLKFEKTIIQLEKNTFLRFEKQYLDRWCPPIISRGVILPIGAMLWPINLNDKRVEYHLNPSEHPIVTSKIMRGSGFDKAHMVEEGYIKDDVDYIFNDMEKQMELIKKEMEDTVVTPTITTINEGSK